MLIQPQKRILNQLLKESEKKKLTLNDKTTDYIVVNKIEIQRCELHTVIIKINQVQKSIECSNRQRKMCKCESCLPWTKQRIKT